MSSKNKVQVLKTSYILAGVIVLIALSVSFPALRKEIAVSKAELPTPDKYWDEAIGFVQKGELVQAIGSFQHYLESGGKKDEIFLKMSELYVKTGQLDQALESARKFVALAPASPNAFFQLGLVYNILGQTSDARLNYQKTVELDPGFTEAYFNLGFLNESDGQYLQAIELYSKVVELDARHAKAFYNLGNSYASLGKDDSAIQAYKSAIAIDKNYLDAYVNLSIIMARNSMFGEAISYLDEARLLGYEAPEDFIRQLDIYREDKAVVNLQKGGSQPGYVQ